MPDPYNKGCFVLYDFKRRIKGQGEGARAADGMRRDCLHIEDAYERSRDPNALWVWKALSREWRREWCRRGGRERSRREAEPVRGIGGRKWRYGEKW